MPVPFPDSYDNLCQSSRQGKSLGRDTICPNPRCCCRGKLVFTDSWVERGVTWPKGKTGAVFQRKPIPLARCQVCGGRYRVLPREVLPRKTYSLPVIENSCTSYPRSGKGLRKTVNSIQGDHPHFSTLHGWLGGLGVRALDRVKIQKKRSPRGGKKFSHSGKVFTTAALVAESGKKLRRGVVRKWHSQFYIPSWKYKGERRRDQLEACARLFSAASYLFPDEPYPLTSWQSWLIKELHVAGWVFPARAACTAIQLPTAGQDVVGSFQEAKSQRKGKSHGSRSPPGGMLAV